MSEGYYIQSRVCVCVGMYGSLLSDQVLYQRRFDFPTEATSRTCSARTHTHVAFNCNGAFCEPACLFLHHS